MIVGDVLNVSKRPMRGRRTLVTARITDGTATVGATWFNQPWIADQLQPGMRVRVRGKNRRYGFDVQVVRPRRGARDRRLRARLSRGGGDHGEDRAPRRRSRAAARRRLLRPAARGAARRARRCRSSATRSRSCIGPQSEDEAERGRRRLAFDELLAAPDRHRAPRRRARAHARTVARRAGRADRRATARPCRSR